jgi:ribonuclease HII
LPAGLKDSKLLSRKLREQLITKLVICCEFGEGWVKCSEIDKLGLSKALKLGAKRALANIQISTVEEIVLDGKFNYLPKKYKNSRTQVNGDNLILIISAASIYAKVMRDRYMIDIAKRYPGYLFEKHVGYGTKAHMLALNKRGALKYVHRHSFSPVAQINGALLLKLPTKD